MTAFIKSLLAYAYPVLGKIAGNCAWSAQTLGAYISKFTDVKIGPNSIISFRSTLDSGKRGKIKVGRHCQIKKYTFLLAFGGKIELGNYVSINPFTILYGHGGICIGNNVSIAAGTMVSSMDHIFSDRNILIQKQGIRARGIIVEDDVWIGAHVTILDGVKIGKGSVIGAGSVVNNDIPSYSVAVGVPCRVVKRRE